MIMKETESRTMQKLKEKEEGAKMGSDGKFHALKLRT